MIINSQISKIENGIKEEEKSEYITSISGEVDRNKFLTGLKALKTELQPKEIIEG